MSQSARPDFRFSLKWLLAATAVVAVLLALLLEVSSWWVSSSVTLQIEAGMTRSEVTQVLGKPHRIESHSDHELWLYNVWEAGDKFKIKFNSEEVVEWATF